jgi:hypothetical protein
MYKGGSDSSAGLRGDSMDTDMNRWIYKEKERTIDSYPNEFINYDWYIVGDSYTPIIHIVKGKYCCRSTPYDDECWKCRTIIPEEIKAIAFIIKA